MIYKSKTLIRKTGCINISIYLRSMETHKGHPCCKTLQKSLPCQGKMKRPAALPQYSSSIKHKPHFPVVSRNRSHPSLNEWEEPALQAIQLKWKNISKQRHYVKEFNLKLFSMATQSLGDWNWLNIFFCHTGFHVKLATVCTYIHTQRYKQIPFLFLMGAAVLW